MEPPLLHRLLLYHHQGKQLFRDSAYSILQDCIRNKDIATCRILHCLILFHQLDSVPIIGDHLIRLFGSHALLLEANLVFCKALQGSTYTWEALISAYVNQGEYERSLALYSAMDTCPSKCVYLAVLKACGTTENIDKGRFIHAEIVKARLDSDLVVESSLLNMYAQCGELEDASRVFDEWAGDDVVMWNTMIAAYTTHGHGLSSLKLYERMEQKHIKPDQVTCVCILKACVRVGLLMQGLYVHDEIIRRGFDSNGIVGNMLVDMYAKFRHIKESERMFSLSSQNVVSWNTKIAGYIQDRRYNSALDLFKKMQQQGLKPDKVSFLSAIKACTNMEAIGMGQMIHDEFRRQGLGGDLAVNNALIHMYAKGGNLELARKVFDSLSGRDMVSWGAMISGYIQYKQHKPAFKLVCNMLSQGIKPKKVVFLCLLKACGDKEALEDGQLVHHQIIELELEIDNAVASTLIDMYAKCKSLDEAWNVFETLPNRDVVCWSVMIAGYIQQGNNLLAFDLFERMQQEDIKPDKVTYLCLLKASGNLKALQQGKQIHHSMIKDEPDVDVVVGSTLVDMYVKCSDLEEARQVFDKMPIRNEVSWTVMIAGYLQHGRSLPALDLFQEMMKEGLPVDKVITLGILKAAGSLGAIGPGMVVHDHIIRSMATLDVMLCNTLIDMYGKCGRLKEAHKVFELLPSRDEVSWNAIIAADAQNENHDRAIQAFEDMKQEGFRPAESTFTSILASCCQAGLIDDARWHFEHMIKDYGIAPTVEHVNCMIDLLGRCARFYEARHFIETMSITPDITTWLSLLAASRSYKNVEFGRFCFDEAVRLDPNVAAVYVLMSNIYVDANMWEDARKLQLLRQRAHVQKKPEAAGLKVQERLLESCDPQAQALSTVPSISQGGCLPRLTSVYNFVSTEDEQLAMAGHHRLPSSDALFLSTPCTDHAIAEPTGRDTLHLLSTCQNSTNDYFVVGSSFSVLRSAFLFQFILVKARSIFFMCLLLF